MNFIVLDVFVCVTYATKFHSLIPKQENNK